MATKKIKFPTLTTLVGLFGGICAFFWYAASQQIEKLGGADLAQDIQTLAAAGGQTGAGIALTSQNLLAYVSLRDYATDAALASLVAFVVLACLTTVNYRCTGCKLAWHD